jgi:uncharacterized surface protein with fasciclin (FAS1) repeats
MIDKQQRSILWRVSLMSLIPWISLNAGFSSMATVPAEGQEPAIRAEAQATVIAQFPTEAIEGVGRGDLARLILSDDRFTILGTLLRTTGLLTQLQQGKSLTLFAPTDEAFRALPDQVLAALMQPENLGQLTNLLKYHLIQGRVTSQELSSGNIESLQGSPLNIDVSSEQVRVGEATVIEPDLEASNGMVHVIDRVMILPE